MKILLIAGHGAGDPGASGNGYQEYKLTRELVNLIAPKLREYATVDIYDTTRNAFKDVQNGRFNVGKYDYVLEIHFNAYSDPKAHGSEIYVTTSEKGITVEQGIMKNMKRYFTLRDNDSVFDGVKRTNFLVIKTLKNKGISGALIEVCFITNKNDMIVYSTNKDAIAGDIVAGIVKGFGLKKRATTTTVKKTITVGSKVKVSSDAHIGGLASNRGDKASPYLKSKTWIVEDIETHIGVKEALLKGADTWVPVKYLTVI